MQPERKPYRPRSGAHGESDTFEGRHEGMPTLPATPPLTPHPLPSPCYFHLVSQGYICLCRICQSSNAAYGAWWISRLNVRCQVKLVYHQNTCLHPLVLITIVTMPYATNDAPPNCTAQCAPTCNLQLLSSMIENGSQCPSSYEFQRVVLPYLVAAKRDVISFVYEGSKVPQIIPEVFSRTLAFLIPVVQGPYPPATQTHVLSDPAFSSFVQTRRSVGDRSRRLCCPSTSTARPPLLCSNAWRSLSQVN